MKRYLIIIPFMNTPNVIYIYILKFCNGIQKHKTSIEQGNMVHKTAFRRFIQKIISVNGCITVCLRSLGPFNIVSYFKIGARLLGHTVLLLTTQPIQLPK